MNRIRKFDLFLLERFPLLWHTKICYMLLYSALLSLVFYFWGYVYTNQFHLNNRPIDLYFSDSYATFFLVIFFIIGTTFWALSYFKKNAVKNFYPLQRFYFTKLFLNFLLIFWSLTWPCKTFHWGVNQKVRTLVSIEELKREIETINVANAFLPESNSDYAAESFLATKYPNVQWIRYNKSDSTWSDGGITLYEDSLNATTAYVPQDNSGAINRVEGAVFQLLRTKKIETGDSCDRDYYTIVTKQLRYEDLTTHTLFDLRNYGKELISPAHFEVPEYNLFQSYWSQFHYAYRYSNEYYDNAYLSLNLEINQQVNQLLDKQDPKAVSNVVKRYQKLLKKYAIDHYLEPDTILDYLANHPKWTTGKVIVSGTNWDLKQTEYARRRFSSFEAYQEYRDANEIYGNPPAYFVDQGQVKDLYENVSDANYPYLDWKYLLTTLLIAIALSLVFILFSFSDLLTLLLAIPFGGILIVLNVLCIVFLTSFGIHKNFDLKISLHIMFFMLLMYGLLFWFFHSKKVHKRILNITFYLCFILTVFLPHALLFLIDNLFQEEVISSCGNEYTQHTVFFYWLSDPVFSLLLPTLAMILFMKFIKPIHSKAD